MTAGPKGRREKEMTARETPPFAPSAGAAKARFFLIGNRLAVDFANTVRAPGAPGEPLSSWQDFVDFLGETKLVAEGRLEQLRGLSAAAPEATEEVLHTAIGLRTGIRKALETLASGQRVPTEAVKPINAVLRWTEGYDQLVPAGEGWRLGFVERHQRLEWLLAAIARSAAKLIDEGPGAPVRKCAGPTCVLYFYDTSRTGRRRWCSMAVCGNRSKAAAHARRFAARGQGKK
jgi:predicted RNA-binding Zn ribbon-like protein